MNFLNKYKNIIILLLIDFLFALYFIENVRQIYFINLGINIKNVGILIFIYTFSKTIFEVPTGYISDKYGRKISVIIGVIIVFFATILLYFQNFYILMLSSLILGFGKTFISGSFDAIIYEEINNINNEKIKLIQNINKYMWYFGYSISAYISIVLYERYNNINIIILLTITILFLITLLLLTVKDKEKNCNKNINFKEGIKYIIGHKKLIGIMINFLCFVMIDIPFDFYILVYFSELGITLTDSAIIISILTFIPSFFSLFVLKINYKFDILIVKYIHILTSIIFILITFTNNKIIILTLLFIKGIIFSIGSPSRNLLKNKLIINKYRATALSVFSLIVGLSSSIFTPLFSIIWGFTNIQFAIRTLSLLSIIIILINAKTFLKELKEIDMK